MAPPTETRRWKIDGNPNDPRAKWVPKTPGQEWTSKSTGNPDLQKIQGWIEDMQEWSVMMYEAVIRLGGVAAPIAQLQQNVALLQQDVAGLTVAVDLIKQGLPPVPR